MDSTCYKCGRPTRMEKSKFELRAFIFTGGPRVTQVGYSVTPDGLSIHKCWTNEGCGEYIMLAADVLNCEHATRQANKDFPELQAMLVEIRSKVSFP